MLFIPSYQLYYTKLRKNNVNASKRHNVKLRSSYRNNVGKSEMKVMIISCVIDVVFVLSLFERAISSAGSLSTVDAKVMPQYDNLILNETADQIMTNTTPLYCANTCLTDPYCMSYFYNVLTKVCKVFHNDFIDTSKAIAENGWRYFHVLRGMSCIIRLLLSFFFFFFFFFFSFCYIFTSMILLWIFLLFKFSLRILICTECFFGLVIPHFPIKPILL